MYLTDLIVVFSEQQRRSANTTRIFYFLTLVNSHRLFFDFLFLNNKTLSRGKE